MTYEPMITYLKYIKSITMMCRVDDENLKYEIRLEKFRNITKPWIQN